MYHMFSKLFESQDITSHLNVKIYVKYYFDIVQINVQGLFVNH